MSLQYTWETGPQFRQLSGAYRAFVHFVDPEGVILFTDDHVPLPSPSSWVPGGKYSYRRIVLSSPFPHVGNIDVVMGLYSISPNGARLALQGNEWGRRREYKVASANLLRPDPELFPVCDGLTRPASGAGAPFAVSRFVVREATCSFANPMEDVILLFDCDIDPRGFQKPPVLTFSAKRSAGARVTFALASERTLVRVRLPVSALGSKPRSSIHLAMDASYSPKLAGLGDDARQISLRVFGIAVIRAGSLDAELVDGAIDAAPLSAGS
jgi:hypothetical protein